MATETGAGVLASLSEALAGVVERTAASVVRVDDGSRLTATGVVWTADGVILTTSHGVERDEELTVEMSDGAALAATLVGRDEDTDLAVLRVAATGLPAVERADPEAVKVGHLVLALGRPGTAGLQATIGIISAKQETQTGGNPEYILHTDAVLYPGFSGGPLVDMNGGVVGITNRMFGRGSGVALGTPLAAHVAETLLAGGHVSRGYLGVRTQVVALPSTLRDKLGAAQEHGLLIVGLESGGPAEKGGLLLGDVLLGVAGEVVTDPDALRGYLRARNAGESVAFHLVRGGARHDLSVALGAES